MNDPVISECINPTCPISGKPVESDSLTLYRDHTVGFSTPECRDQFAENPDDYPEAKALLDERIETERKEAEEDDEETPDE